MLKIRPPHFYRLNPILEDGEIKKKKKTVLNGKIIASKPEPTTQNAQTVQISDVHEK